jgi:hypothetical protein
MAQIIYPTRTYNFQKQDTDWSTARNAGESDSYVVGNGTNEKVLISFNGTEFTFLRAYMSFDLSSVVGPINTAKLYIQASVVERRVEIVIAYAGVKDISGGGNPIYSYYLDNIDGPKNPWSIIYMPDNRAYYSGNLDLTAYPIDLNISTTYVIGIISKSDFRNSIGDSDSGIIGTNVYLSINEAGYPNAVMGVPGANISTVSGVPLANISKVMGV